MAHLGFGIMRFQDQQGYIDYDKVKLMIDEYMKGDFCYFDFHPAYVLGKAQSIVREYIVDKYPRGTFMIANKMPYYGIKEYDDYKKIFEKQLGECGVDFFDNYLLHAITSQTYDLHQKFGGFKFLIQLKQEGRAKRIGISFHASAKLLEEILEHHPEIDFVYLQINFLDWDSDIIQSRKCYEVCRKYNKDIIVMEPIKGGSLAKDISISGNSILAPELARKSLEFVASLEGVYIILSGMAEISHVKENRLTINNFNGSSIDFEYYNNIKNIIEEMQYVPCTKCEYCKRECPKGIAIPEILNFLNQSKNLGKNDTTWRGRYSIFYKGYIEQRKSAKECISCKKCEKYCPQKIEISKYLKEAKELFEPATPTKVISKYKLSKRLELNQDDEVILFGTGNFFHKNLDNVLVKHKIKYVCDNNKDKWGKEVAPQIICISPNELTSIKNSVVIIMTESASDTMCIANQLLDLGIFRFEHVSNWLKS